MSIWGDLCRSGIPADDTNAICRFEVNRCRFAMRKGVGTMQAYKTISKIKVEVSLRNWRLKYEDPKTTYQHPAPCFHNRKSAAERSLTCHTVSVCACTTVPRRFWPAETIVTHGQLARHGSGGGKPGVAGEIRRCRADAWCGTVGSGGRSLWRWPMRWSYGQYWAGHRCPSGPVQMV